MEDRDEPGPAKKVVVRRVIRPVDDPPAAPEDERTRTLPRPRLSRGPKRERDEPRVPMRRRITHLARHGFAATRLGMEIVAGEVRSLRWPSISPRLAAVVVGAGAGLTAAGLGALETWGVSEVRGVAGGAGGVGLLLIAALVGATVVASSFVLHRLGSPRYRTVPALGMIAALTLVLAFFLEPAGSAWALLLLPLIGAGCFAGADRVLSLAADAPGDDDE